MNFLGKLLGWDIPSTDNITEIPLTTPPGGSTSPVAETSEADKLVAAAKACLGLNLSEGTGVSPEVACAIAVNKVHTRAFGFPIGGGASTAELYQALLKSPYFRQADVAVPGSVVISPTGMGKKAAYPHGHVGIVGKYGICSNDSTTGLFSENYTPDSWVRTFSTVRGYPVFYFFRI